ASGKAPTAKPADKPSLASDQPATKEGPEKATSVTWKNTFYERVTSKDGKRTWLKTETRLNAYKAPGLFRETTLDENGQVREVEITDAVNNKQLRVFPATKEAYLSEITNLDPRTPFAWVKKELESTDLQWVETRKSTSGAVNIFRHAFRDRANGKDWSYDFWVDQKTKQLVGIRTPGADIYDPDKDPARNTRPEKEMSTETGGGLFKHDIV